MDFPIMSYDKCIVWVFIVLFVACAGCVTTGNPQESVAAGPRFTHNEVVRIARKTAKDKGCYLSPHGDPLPYYEYTAEDGTWSVLCRGSILGVSEGRFWVIVDDQTGEGELMYAD